MAAAQLEFALAAGRRAIARALDHAAQLFVGGEMGIANTTSASALAAACLQLPASEITGAGTGLLPEQIDRKAAVIAAALQSHRPRLDTPLAILQTLGGFEIAALAGAYIAAAQQGLPVLVDGFISSVAALLAARINPLRSLVFLRPLLGGKGSQPGVAGAQRPAAVDDGHAFGRGQRRGVGGAYAANGLPAA